MHLPLRISFFAAVLVACTSGPAGAQAVSYDSRWINAQGAWTDAMHWTTGLPDALKMALVRGRSELVIDGGRQVVGSLSVGAGKGDDVRLIQRSGELIVRRGYLVIGEEDGGHAEVVLEGGALHSRGDTSIAAINSEPGRACQGTLSIRGGSFVTRILTLGWGPGSTARLAVEGSKPQAVHALEYVTAGSYLNAPPSTTTLAFALDAQGVTPVTVQADAGNFTIVRKPHANVCRLEVTLNAIPPRDDIPLIIAKTKPRGEFDDLPEGADVSAKHEGREFHWTLTYRGGSAGTQVALTHVRGHAAGDPVTHTRPVPETPAPLWPGIALRRPLPMQFEPAFEGAEGFGAMAAGGRGGRELAVTSLDDHGPGTLRAVIEEKGPRIIRFKVGGVIHLETPLVIREPNVSVLGQDAPPPGIALRGHGMMVMTHDVVLRHLRVRPGSNSHQNDAIEFYNAERCIADHCSLEWGDDETCSITGMSDAITIQHCLIAEGLNHKGHSMASIAGGERTTWHHNLMAHCRTRNPRFGEVARCDFRNNVVYNWGDTGAYGEFEGVNFIGNVYKPGPSTTQKPPRFHIGNAIVPPGTFYAMGNVMWGDAGASVDNWRAIGLAPEARAERPFEAPAVRTQPGAEVYSKVLESAGAVLPVRDETDARIIKSAKEGGGRIIDTEAEVEK